MKRLSRLTALLLTLAMLLSLVSIAHAEEKQSATAWLLYFASNHETDSSKFPWWPQHKSADQPSSETGVEATNAEVTGPGMYTVGLKFNWQKAEGAIQFNLVLDNAESLFPGYYVKITDIRVNGKSIDHKPNLYGTFHDDPNAGFAPIYNNYWDKNFSPDSTGPDGLRAFDSADEATYEIINPDDIVRDYGADTLRLYEMFMGDFEKAAPWSMSSVRGCKRFLERIWNLQDLVVDGDSYRKELETPFHQTIKKVSEDIENLKYNTAIAAMMSLLNVIADTGSITRKEYRDLLVLLNPFAPHMTEELFEIMGFGGPITSQKWLTWDEAKCKEATVEIVAQVNGKIRAKLTVDADIQSADAIALAKADPKVAAEIAGKTVVKELYVKGKLVNLVVK